MEFLFHFFKATCHAPLRVADSLFCTQKQHNKAIVYNLKNQQNKNLFHKLSTHKIFNQKVCQTSILKFKMWQKNKNNQKF